MVYFPQRQSERNSGLRSRCSPSACPRTADFAIDGPEFELYQEDHPFREAAKRTRGSARTTIRGREPSAS